MFHDPYKKNAHDIPGLVPEVSRESITASKLPKLVDPVFKPGALPVIPGIIPEKVEKEDKDASKQVNGTTKAKLKTRKEADAVKFRAPGIPVSQQIHTVFFNGMPKISDKALDGMLGLLPTISAWTRLKDVCGYNTDSGFITFSSAMGVAVARRCLGELTVMDGEEEKKINVTCEENTMSKIDDVNDALILSETGKSPANLIDSMQAIIDGTEVAEEEEDEEEEEELPLSQITFDVDPFYDVIEPDRTNLKNDIKNFRNSAVNAEKDAFAKRGEFGKQRISRRTTAAEKVLGHVKGTSTSSSTTTTNRATDLRLSEKEREMYREYSRELHSIENRDKISDEDYAVEIMDKKEDEVEDLFIEAQKRWLSYENGRLRDLVSQWKQVEPEELENNRKTAIARLLDYDDDKERSKERHIYYYDHATWSRNRAEFRDGEIRREKEEAEEGEEAEVAAPVGPITISLKPKEDPKEAVDVLSKPVSVPDVGRLTEYVGEQVEEFLGAKEEDLIKFIVDHIVSGHSAQELITELEGPLDEEGAILVKNVWGWLQ
ncbi:hypothetical protein B0I72DRAFT_140380 [Yarrowia lipolytica]|jgi:hypothetical protein|uniref:U1 small nuclear ribonucleoprotein component SNU71 n=2 Tax=Yarrowia lipolytica TaxID=4952 RepID=Q6CAR7_YARLI|nr:YALI0D00539p [Yarrowia lipolytica CLIB122]AOW03382.1 hypothetical protein YALI1_D00537g [Yarrowia lipolytica]KAB8282584.1 hypothetical protein BKA91DRAFT_138342 [Yarrowia lipolytica]KAE8173234.1 hypothetical protein BKA90DRAFT_136128 [Yarrowia lipolytica]KAJ8054957.1 hypothetical protein LXG23DRAFT_37048 [Yarrowia lipolytica]QNP97566.1 U1 small nuclear ribonucleoprotein component SNU71 [Yarrowia lipolytica]|eukprot:XP_502245.1 YALI0D00539p [Yarrowia lipolytica CLIB122]